MADKVTPRRGGDPGEPTNAADKRQQSEKDAKAWKSHIHKRIVEAVEDIGSFLTEFVHSEKPVPACPDVTFSAKVPTGKGKEHRMYGPLVKGLTSLVRQFEKKKRPEFVNHAHNVMRFPFALGDDDQHVTKPDVVATIPELPYIPLLIAGEMSPWFSRPNHAHEETLVQLAKSARNIMLAQGRLFAFVIGIYGHKARIFRFDRAGAVCSPPFDYMKEPQILHAFFYRFLNPKQEGCVVVGDDPTSSLGTHEDRARVQDLTQKYDPSYTYTAENRKAVRRFIVTNGKEKTTYLAYKLIFVNPRLFSRATTIWEAFELDEQGEGTGKRVVIKEAWRQFVRASEIGFYRLFQEAADEAEESTALSFANIAEFEYGDDLGLREARKLAGEDKDTVAPSTADECFEDFPELDVPYWHVVGHRTVTARCRDGDIEYNERSQTRLVSKTIGVPITDFESTYELATALRDAIEGHRQAYVAGVVHRDISNGNVMIARRPDGSIIGFIHDFDYAFSWKRFLRGSGRPVNMKQWDKYVRDEYKDVMQTMLQRMVAKMRGNSTGEPAPNPKDPKNDHKQRTGTLHFMAIEVLNEHADIPHEAQYDLESFYWLLVWIVLRHTAYLHLDGEQAWHRLFDARLHESIALKESWLRKEPSVMVESNEALTGLLEDFRKLCKRNHEDPDARMTHEEVLAIFNKALEKRDAWPKDDRAKPWTPPKYDPVGEIPGMERPSGQRRSKGTLTYTSQGASRDISSYLPRPPVPTRRANELHEGQQTETETDSSDTDAQDAAKAARRKGRARVARGQSTGGRTATTRTSTTESNAVGTHEIPPSSDGGSSQSHPSGYLLRSVKTKKADEVQQSTSSTSPKMGPPPAPRTRSRVRGSQSQSSKRPASRQGGASKRGSSATKRTRTREEEDEDDVGDDAGSSHSSKRPRTLSNPRNTRSSRKPRGKRT
ncbi:uncharacterized protein B0H18DRAFT_1120886 [Fomitopsis serialis]|uniref:uncharacterized protein n=1 Tax=Fomitopsis serialis TaxID=139415 RepID=UPI002008B0F5|nr:uncharacterized protein B0H18DRAFT_1120886 [Neoantrodia serialis]KAH9922497.1 hypothetical protein B0H18DRAFT_1120886 [Neoantrodia serialis]